MTEDAQALAIGDEAEGMQAVDRVTKQYAAANGDHTHLWSLKIDDIRIAARFKGGLLFAQARKRARIRKALNLCFGLIALFSGASITAIISELVSSFALKVLSAAGALFSGAGSLLLTAYFDDEETNRMFVAASQFLALESNASVEKDHPGLDRLQAHMLTRGLMNEFIKASRDADRYLPDRQQTGQILRTR
jgi:hypothetical protein